MRFGIIGAMKEEIKHLLNDMEISKADHIGMRTYYSGRLFDKDAVVVFSRWGKVAASSTVTTLIEKYNVDFIIFTGVAGAADKKLEVGDIVIADRLVQHDMDCSKLPGFKRFEIPLLNKESFDIPHNLVAAAKKSAQNYVSNVMKDEIATDVLFDFGINNPKVIVGTIASGDQFIADKNKVETLALNIENLQCVEMEGAAVAQVCYEYNVNCLVIRVISDKADIHADIDFNRFIEKAASHFTRGIIKEFILGQ